MTASKIGYYLRTSHFLQQIERQQEKIEPGWKVFEDKGVSGRIAFADRPQGKKLLSDVTKGQITEVHVDTLDRLGRSTENILQTLRFFHEHNVGVHIKKEGIITLVDGKENYITSLLLKILSAISEMELLRLKERTLEGIAIGKRNHIYKGRKLGAVESIETLMQKPKVAKIKKLLDEKMSIRNICQVLDCSPNYIYKIKDRIEKSK